MSTKVINTVCHTPYAVVARCGGTPEFILDASLPMPENKTLSIFVVFEGLPIGDDEQRFINNVLDWARRGDNLDCYNSVAAYEKIWHTHCSSEDVSAINECLSHYANGGEGYLIATPDRSCPRICFFYSTPGKCGLLLKNSAAFQDNAEESGDESSN